MLTNDKFCFIRQRELALSWWRKPLGTREKALQQRQKNKEKTQGRMKRAWKIRVSRIEKKDGQHRWDMTYQLVVKWATSPKEEEDESCDLWFFGNLCGDKTAFRPVASV
jgi:hypothetical protein